MTARSFLGTACPLVLATAWPGNARAQDAQDTQDAQGPRGAPAARSESPAAAPIAPETPGFIAKRVLAELMMGAGTATLGYLAAPSAFGVGCADCVRAASLVGASAAFPFGVYWGGRMVRGDGTFAYTVAAPWIVSIATAAALARDQSADGRPAIDIGTWGSVIAAPLSILAFELSHAMNRASTRSAHLRWTLTPLGDGVGVALVVREAETKRERE